MTAQATQSRAACSRHPFENSIWEGTRAGGFWRRSGPQVAGNCTLGYFCEKCRTQTITGGHGSRAGVSELAPQSRDTMFRVWEQKRRVSRGLVRPGVLALLRTATWRAITVLAGECANQLLAAWDCTFVSLRSLFRERL